MICWYDFIILYFLISAWRRNGEYLILAALILILNKNFAVQ